MIKYSDVIGVLGISFVGCECGMNPTNVIRGVVLAMPGML